MKTLIHSTSRKTRGGFSLIEVTIAMGITAVALVSLMGMLPKGLQTLRRAADKAIEGRIHQQVLGELQLTSWEAPGSTTPGSGGKSPLDSFHKQVRFYDDQGIELKAGEKGQPQHVYTARIHVPKQGDELPPSVGGGRHIGVVEPTVSGSGAVTYARVVVVEVTSIVDDKFLTNPQMGFDKEDYRKHIHTFQTVVAKMGQEFDPAEEGP